MQEVKRLRLQRGWNQTALAFHADLAPSVISEIENGKRNPSASTLKKLAGAFGVEVGDLFPKATAPLFEEDEQRRSSDTGKQGYARIIEAWTDHVRSRTRSWNEKLAQVPEADPDRPWRRPPGAEVWANQVSEDTTAMVRTTRNMELWEAGDDAIPLLRDLFVALLEMDMIGHRWGSTPDPTYIAASVIGPDRMRAAEAKIPAAKIPTAKLDGDPEDLVREFREQLEKFDRLLVPAP